MQSPRVKQFLCFTATIGLAAAALAGCSGPSQQSSSSGDAAGEPIEITYLVGAEAVNVDYAEKVIAAFEEKHPDIRVTLVTGPLGTEGENLTKTKLATDEMEDVFTYNAGSLLQALQPDQNLVDLSGEQWQSHVTEDFKATVSTDNGVYGAPNGGANAGGMLYNVKVYEELGLEVPQTWDEFLTNAQKIKDSGLEIDPITQAFADTWTSQLFVLGSFGNVIAQDPQWAEKYTANEVKYAEHPALDGFEYQQEIFEAGFLNEDFASLTNEQAIARLAEGKSAHYPMQTVATNTINLVAPDNQNDVGFFAIPARDAQYTTATIWQPHAYYIPKTTTGSKLDAAKTFVEFLAVSEESCELSKQASVPAGPHVTDTCPLDDDVPRVVKDVQAYFDSGKTASALEYLSPVKGPNLENIAVEVGSGFRPAADGAASYDEDVKKQAKQLGLPGW